MYTHGGRWVPCEILCNLQERKWIRISFQNLNILLYDDVYKEKGETGTKSDDDMQKVPLKQQHNAVQLSHSS